MPLPRKKDDGSTGGAPVLDIPAAHVRLFDVTEHVEPHVVTRQSDGAQFTLDPGFYVSVEVVANLSGGDGAGAKFYESFRYKQDSDSEWFNKENSKLGILTKAVKPDYFEDDSIAALEAENLEGFEMFCRVKPKKNPSSGAVTGSTIDWETMRPLPKNHAAASVSTSGTDDEDDFADLPF